MVGILKRHASLPRLTAALLSVVALGACSPPQSAAGSASPGDPRLDPTERAVRLRVALTALQPSREELPTVEFSRAESWLARAELLTRAGADPELRDLLLDTAEGQLTLMRSHIALQRTIRTPSGPPTTPHGPPETYLPPPLPSADGGYPDSDGGTR